MTSVLSSSDDGKSDEFEDQLWTPSFNMGDVLVLFEVGGVKRFAGALTSSAAKGETFQAWYMEGDAKGLYCLDASTTRSDVRTLNRECIVTKVHTYARTPTHTHAHILSHTRARTQVDGAHVDIGTGEVIMVPNEMDWPSVEKTWQAYHSWVAKHMPEALDAPADE